MSKFDPLREVLAGMHGAPIALDETRGSLIHAIATELAEGRDVSDARLAAACGRAPASPRAAAATDLGAAFRAAVGGSSQNRGVQIVANARGARVAVVPLRGLINFSFDFPPYAASTEQFTRTIAELTADKTVASIVISTDSAGGFVVGTPEASDAVFAARQVKPVLAIVGGGLAASAAYWIVAATEISSLASGEGVGSIGVRMAHVDVSGALNQAGVRVTQVSSGAHKVEGSPYAPPSPETVAFWQSESDRIYAQFIGAVARGRGVDVKTVLTSFGQGRVIDPAGAKTRGMIDRLESGDAAFTRALEHARAPKTVGQVALEVARMGMEL